MPNGTVKFFNAEKKFGFVSPDDGGKDVFVPVASVTAAGISTLIAGQRVSFETAPDGRGPKAVNLTLLEGPAPASVVRKTAVGPKAEENPHQLTLYYDPLSEYAAKVLAELRASGFEPRIVNYVATPPSADDLKKLSMLLHDGSLVRRYDSLFHDLRLDDRFIGQNEFWHGIFENPKLINGPVLATRNGACICRSRNAVDQFLDDAFPGRTRSMRVEKVVAERAVESASEIVAANDIAADTKTAVLEISQASSTPSAKLPANKKRAKATPTEKRAKTQQATKAIKKATGKAAPKSPRLKTK